MSLSEQQMVDCADGDYGDYGCDGGLPAFAMLYSDANPLMSEEDYPYIEADGNCSYDKSKGLISAGGFTLVEPNDPYQMQAAVELGPVTVALDASSFVFQFYKKGVFDSADRCGTELNHAVTVVGYSNLASSTEKPYWIVRNSWGADWGEDGYIRIAIEGGEGVCGINIEVTYPNIYYLNVYDQSYYIVMCALAVCLSLWPLARLTWCKNEDLLYLHEGQRGLVRIAYTQLAFYSICIVLFAVSLGAPPLPTWMIYRSSVFVLYAATHIFLCLLHFYMGMLERLQGDKVRSHTGFSCF